MPLLEVVGNADKEAPLQMGAMAVKVGTAQNFPSPVIVQPLPPLAMGFTKLALSASAAQYFKGEALSKFLLV